MRYRVSITNQRGHNHVVGDDTMADVAASPGVGRARANSSALASAASVASPGKEEIALEKCNHRVLEGPKRKMWARISQPLLKAVAEVRKHGKEGGLPSAAAG